ncbi:MAG: L-rhamnose mutarotase [Phycisphaerae bacterium]|nr:L-rhamnose mutarotase [Phycisphaerae bacterium]
MQRFAQVIRIRPDKLDEYRRLHADCWPEILEMMRRQNIRNCSIYHRDGLLFMYYEYVGTDFAADQARFADDPTMQRWLAVTAACQQPVDSADGDGWAPMEELFHLD